MGHDSRDIDSHIVHNRNRQPDCVCGDYNNGHI
jgi:hypothetical protein